MDPFLGEIRLMPYTFTTRGWLPCAGQIMAISQNTALFSLLGTRYGGNGQNTFALPDLRGRAAMGMSQNYPQGSVLGTENVSLITPQMPAHTHTISAPVSVSNVDGNNASPANSFFAANQDYTPYGTSPNHGPMAPMISGTAGPVGGSQPHENRMPFLALTYCIATVGLFPQRQ